MVLARTTLRDTSLGRAMPGVSPPNNRADRTDEFRIDLIRNLAPQQLILFGDRQLDRDEWARHCRQQTEYILAATRGPADMMSRRRERYRQPGRRHRAGPPAQAEVG